MRPVATKVCRRWLLVLSLFALACSAKRLDPVVERPIAELASVEVGGLRIAVEPLLDGRAAKAQYGIDFLGQDVLAVRVVAQNRDPEASYVLFPRCVTLVAEGGDARAPVADNPASYTPALATAAAAHTLMIASVAVAPLILPAVPLAMWSGKQSSDIAVIRHQLLLESLYPTTLSPGEDVDGLVLLPYPEASRAAALDVCVVSFDLRARTSSNTCFPLPRAQAAR